MNEQIKQIMSEVQFVKSVDICKVIVLKKKHVEQIPVPESKQAFEDLGGVEVVGRLMVRDSIIVRTAGGQIYRVPTIRFADYWAQRKGIEGVGRVEFIQDLIEKINQDWDQIFED